MRKAHQYTPKQHKTNNFGNNFITIESFLSADFKNQTEEQFAKCLEQVNTINTLLIDKGKCPAGEYRKILNMANAVLSMAMVERRMGIVEHNKKGA